jgi:hypothetical protein
MTDDVIVIHDKQEITKKEACRKYDEYYIFFIITKYSPRGIDAGYVSAISKDQIALLQHIIHERETSDYSNISTGLFWGDSVKKGTIEVDGGIEI